MGHQAVIIFFVLSGFFVGGGFISDINKNIISYSIKRISRFYTVLFPALCLTFVLDLIGIIWSGATDFYQGNSLNYVLNYNVIDRLDINTFFFESFLFSGYFL